MALPPPPLRAKYKPRKSESVPLALHGSRRGLDFVSTDQFG